jgi:hypothetical protein
MVVSAGGQDAWLAKIPFERAASRRWRNNGAPPAFSRHFQSQPRFRQAFPKKALAVLWDFNGLQAARPDNEVSPKFLPLPPTFRPISAAATPHSGAAHRRGARARARDCVAKGSVAFMEVG